MVTANDCISYFVMSPKCLLLKFFVAIVCVEGLVSLGCLRLKMLDGGNISGVWLAFGYSC